MNIINPLEKLFVSFAYLQNDKLLEFDNALKCAIIAEKIAIDFATWASYNYVYDYMNRTWMGDYSYHTTSQLFEEFKKTL